MLCDNCGQEEAKIRYITRNYGNLLIIENIPVISCPNCGESYLTAQTLQEIHRIKENCQEIAIKIPVNVASF
jgi:YgiT-type zinc finger domain-containing protein